MRSHWALAPLLIACAAPAEDAQTEAADLSTVTTNVACTTPAPTGDGQWIVYGTCSSPTATAEVTVLAVADGRKRRLARLGAGDELQAVGTKGTYAYWAVRRADGNTDFSVVPITPFDVMSSTPTTIPLGANVRTTDELIVLAAATFATIIETAPGQQELLLAHFTSSTPLQRTPLPPGSYRLWGSHFARRFAIAEVGTASPRVAALELFSSHAVLSPFVQPSLAAGEYIPASFDGEKILAKHRPTSDTEGITAVDVHTGQHLGLAEVQSFKALITVNDDYVWYSARRPTGHVLERVARHGTPWPTTLATDMKGVWGRMSADRQKLLVRRGPEAGMNELVLVASDGATPETVLLPLAAKKSVYIRSEHEAFSPRVLVSVRDPFTQAESTMLVEDATGAVLTQWQRGVDYTDAWFLDVPSNGGAVYVERGCFEGGVARTRAVHQIWPAVQQLRGCMTGPSEARIDIPKSNALLLDSGQEQTSRVFTIIRP